MNLKANYNTILMKSFFNEITLTACSLALLGVTLYEEEWKGVRNYFDRVCDNSWFMVHGIMGACVTNMAYEYLTN
jgi:hypothetical protein